MTTTERIIAACEKARAKGFRVEPGTWGVGWNAKGNKWAPLKSANKRLCPLGALVLAEQPAPGRYQSVPEAVAKLLGVGMHWVIDFQCAFDGVANERSGLSDRFFCESAGADAAATVFRSLAAAPSEDAQPASEAKGEAGA